MENDGCTFWFDTWRGISLRHCCDAHDTAFATTSSLRDFTRANLDLFACGLNAGVPLWSLLALIGVFSPIAIWLYFRGKKR